MAERSNQKPDPEQSVETLQKRGRRRLVGAIALVLLAVIVLPMVFDPEPRPDAPLVNIRIPSEDNTKFSPKPVPKPVAPQGEVVDRKSQETTAESPPAAGPAREAAAEPVAKAQAPEPAPRSATPKPSAVVPKASEKPVAKAPAKPAAPVEAASPAPVPAPAGEQFMVQVGAFASIDKVKEVTDKLKGDGLKPYTEPVATSGGQVMRVRLGPFASKGAAENARERAKALGFGSASVVPK